MLPPPSELAKPLASPKGLTVHAGRPWSAFLFFSDDGSAEGFGFGSIRGQRISERFSSLWVKEMWRYK